MPEAPDATEIHGALLTAVHPQVLVVDTLRLAEPSLDGTKSDPRVSEYTHAGGGEGAGGEGTGGVGEGGGVGGAGGRPEPCVTTIR